METDTSEKGFETLIVESLVGVAGYQKGWKQVPGTCSPDCHF